MCLRDEVGLDEGEDEDDIEDAGSTSSWASILSSRHLDRTLGDAGDGGGAGGDSITPSTGPHATTGDGGEMESTEDAGEAGGGLSSFPLGRFLSLCPMYFTFVRENIRCMVEQ